MFFFFLCRVGGSRIISFLISFNSEINFDRWAGVNNLTDSPLFWLSELFALFALLALMVGGGLIFFYEGPLFLGRTSSSVVLTRFKEVKLATTSYALSTRMRPFISVCDSALRNYVPPYLSGDITSNFLEIFLGSPKAKVIKDYKLKSDLKSRLVVNPPRQLGHDFFGLERMYFSMHYLQKRCEHLKYTGFVNS